MREYKYVYDVNDDYIPNRFRLLLILTILYSIGIFILSSMQDPLNYFFGL